MDLQKNNPIKTKSFLYDYWNCFFYLFFSKIAQKFKSIIIKKDLGLLDSISINDFYKNSTNRIRNHFEGKNISNNIFPKNNMEKNNIKEQLTKLLFLKNLPNLLYEFQKNNIILGNNKYSNLNTNIKKQDIIKQKIFLIKRQLITIAQS